MPKKGYKFTSEQCDNLSQGHIGQIAWNAGAGGCKRGHAPDLYVAMPGTGVKVCLGCKRENGARYRTENRESIRRKNRLNRYGISETEFKHFWTAQGGACAICGLLFVEHEYHIDHDHKTGAVRGLLCVACNTAIGLLKESTEVLQEAIHYLERANA